ncbi:hypothetical protein [Rhizobium leguminosarum]|uniref:hypothetical protein n=1 Tax=Rhizobium leguminosarum TaxID=384 RepID=UPI0013B6EE85|nr:hypothetical protein [Rhizobium leguminosarum]NEI65045.1 hypothetical protein [Rhizobium leguminosarum]NZD51876.1 hypothetical protein [Rhizobium leguminosarum]
MIEQSYIHFILVDGQLVERRFRSSMPWPLNGRLYALASDPEAIERCKAEALRPKRGRAAELEVAHRHWLDAALAMEVQVKEEQPKPVARKLSPVPANRRPPPLPLPSAVKH